MSMYRPLWELVKKSTVDKPVRVDAHPCNHARIQQAISKLKSQENRKRNFADEPKPLHGRLVATSHGRVLTIYLEFNGDSI